MYCKCAEVQYLPGTLLPTPKVMMVAMTNEDIDGANDR
jgi:hypothetical protein